MKIGYARVSTQDQKLSLQVDALESAGCEKIFKEKMTGTTKNRPELEKMLNYFRSGDVIVIWKLDRLGRSSKDLISLVNQIEEGGGALLSLKDQIDTTTPHGKLIFHVFAALAQFESDIISERTKAGLAAARARGRKGGRPKGLSDEAKRKAKIAEGLYKQGDLSVRQICEHLSISNTTFYNYLKYRKRLSASVE